MAGGSDGEPLQPTARHCPVHCRWSLGRYCNPPNSAIGAFMANPFSCLSVLASSFDLTAEQSFDVDQVTGRSPFHIWIVAVMCMLLCFTRQAGLTGCPAKDVSAIFDGDNVVQHLNDLFDGKPQTRSVSANHQVSQSSQLGVTVEPLCCGHLGDLVECPVYSGTSLLWTPWGPGGMSCIERCPHFRDKCTLRKRIWDIAELSLIQRCPYFRGVLLEGFHCIAYCERGSIGLSPPAGCICCWRG